MGIMPPCVCLILLLLDVIRLTRFQGAPGPIPPTNP